MKYVLVITTLILCFIIWLCFTEKEFATVTHSSGQYRAVVTYYSYKNWIPNIGGIGGGSDTSGFVEIFDSKDESMGKVPIQMLWLYTDLVWEKNSAYIQALAYWDFKTGECYFWNDDEKIVVRNPKE